jgi:predicted N-acetyltransferase YhbS
MVNTPAAMIIRPLAPGDAAAVAALHARAFGPGRFARTAYRVREGTPFSSPFCRVGALANDIGAAVRFTAITIGGRHAALLLGPLAVDPAFANQGYGRALVAQALQDARAAGIGLVLLVGDEPYYARLGFVRVPRGQVTLPGPVDPDRLLAAELKPGSLAAASGAVAAASPVPAAPKGGA